MRTSGHPRGRSLLHTQSLTSRKPLICTKMCLTYMRIFLFSKNFSKSYKKGKILIHVISYKITIESMSADVSSLSSVDPDMV
jgi:hypothetical protein